MTEPTKPQLGVTTLENIKLEDDNPRTSLGDLTELTASIKEHGILEPLLVTSNGGDGKYVLVFGHRRYAAATAAKTKDVPVVVHPGLTPTERLVLQLHENMQRADLSALEEGKAFKRLADLGMSQRDIATEFSKSQAHVSKRIALTELHPKIQAKVAEGAIGLEAAAEVGTLPVEKQPMVLLDEYTRYNRDAVSVVRAVKMTLEIEANRKESDRRLAEEKIPEVIVKGNHLYWSGKEKPLDQLGIKLEAHKDEVCHAAVIDPQNGKLVFICMEPKNHLTAEQKKLRQKDSSGEETKKAAERGKEKAARQRLIARREFLSTVLATRPPRTKILDFTLAQLVTRADSEQMKLACKLLGIEPVMEKRSYGQSQSYYSAMAAFMAKGEAQLDRGSLAVACAIADQRLKAGYNPHGEDKVYLTFLATLGFDPAKVVEPKAPTTITRKKAPVSGPRPNSAAGKKRAAGSKLPPVTNANARAKAGR